MFQRRRLQENLFGIKMNGDDASPFGIQLKECVTKQ